MGRFVVVADVEAMDERKCGLKESWFSTVESHRGHYLAVEPVPQRRRSPPSDGACETTCSRRTDGINWRETRGNYAKIGREMG